MKRIVAFLLCVLLVGSLVGEARVARAEEGVSESAPTMRVTRYTVSGVLNVPNVYELKLDLEWSGEDENSRPVLSSVRLEST